MLENKFGVSLNYLMCIDNKTQLKQFTENYNNLTHIPTFYDFRLHKLFDKIQIDFLFYQDFHQFL